MHIRVVTFMLFALAIAGCSTVSVVRTQGVSGSGKAYVEMLKKVNGLALDKSIEFRADELLKLDRTRETLKIHSDQMKGRASLVARANEYFNALESYFSLLEAVANGDQSESAASALKQIAGTLTKPPVELKLTEEKKKALTGVVAYIGKQIHAAHVEAVLYRDADIIAQALFVSELMLNMQIGWLKHIEDEERKTNEKNVINRFVSSSALGPDWKKAWSSVVRRPPVNGLLLDAKKSSIDMQKAWRDILRGSHSYAETLASIKNVLVGIEAITTLKYAK